MTPYRNIEGQRFDRWTVVSYSGKPSSYHVWFCKCDCGSERIVRESHLINGSSESCGCKHREIATISSTKHGMAKTTEYNSWRGAKERCTKTNHVEYHLYGGRGITFCDRWMNDAKAFMDDMGRKPTPKHSLDRIDNFKGYSPENCRWATKETQDRNRRKRLVAMIGGVTKTIVEWSKVFGMPYATARSRFLQGKPISKSLIVGDLIQV